MASSARLFEKGVTPREWAQFSAVGFGSPVSGLIMDSAAPPCCGVPLGGLGTGAIDLEATGAIGYVTAFPTRLRHPDSRYQTTYREPAVQLPLLGVSVGGDTWVLATRRHIDGGRITGCVEPGMNRELIDAPGWVDAWSVDVPACQGVKPVDRIEYWGHYPVADLEFESACPVSIGLRAWSPFLPGDAEASNTPAAVFEVHLRNTTDAVQQGTIALSFPGPSEEGVGAHTYTCRALEGALRGIAVESEEGRLAWAVGAIDEELTRVGAGLHTVPEGWAGIARELPERTRATDPSASVAVDFELTPGERRLVRFVLAWFAPDWLGGSHTEILGFEQWDIGPYPPSGRQVPPVAYTAMYASRFPNVDAVLDYAAGNHAQLLSRILAWQEATYRSDLPGWLTDALVNGLSVMCEDSFWAAPSEAIGPWSDRNGAFGMIESPRGCSIMGCIVSNWYGDVPLVYFFPELERAVLDNYKAFMRPDGAVPFLFPHGDFTKPTYEWLLPLNGTCFVTLVDRLWRRTGDDDVLRDFYAAVRANTTFQMQLRPTPDGIISVHRTGTGQEWWEHTPVQGMVTHVAGLRLATLQIAERMARAAGDEPFAATCRDWIEAGGALMESSLWMEDAGSYMFFSDPATEAESDDILTSQLDGDWMSFAHGFDGVFDRDRALRALRTMERTCVGPYAVAGFARKDGAADEASAVTFSRDGVPHDTAYGTFTAETDIVGMTFMYHGLLDTGLEIVRRNADNIIRLQGHGWDLPNMVRSDTGERNFGTDYFQKLTIWAVPAALAQAPLEALCKDGGLVHRILGAAVRDSVEAS